MRGLIQILVRNESMIWKVVGLVSAMIGLVCFGLSSTYKMSFGKLGSAGLLVYVVVVLFLWFLTWRAKRIKVQEGLRGLVVAPFFGIICLISVTHDKLLPGKSDALSIISYGCFGLVSLSMSAENELEIETGFSGFFLSMFTSQLAKIKLAFSATCHNLYSNIRKLIRL